MPLGASNGDNWVDDVKRATQHRLEVRLVGNDAVQPRVSSITVDSAVSGVLRL